MAALVTGIATGLGLGVGVQLALGTQLGLQPANASQPSLESWCSGGRGVLPRRLAWAPAAGATSYEVELDSGGALFCHASTPATTIDIAPRSASKPSSPALVPGTYEWSVWPVRDGRRVDLPVVRAKLVIAPV